MASYSPEEEAEIARYPADVQKIIRDQQAKDDFQMAYWMSWDRRERLESGHVVHYDKNGVMMSDGPFHSYFGLSYASWLVLPRLSLQEMPFTWQAKMVALLEEAEALGMPVPDGLYVMRRMNRRFVPNNHWNNYRRGTTAYAEHIDKEMLDASRTRPRHPPANDAGEGGGDHQPSGGDEPV